MNDDPANKFASIVFAEAMLLSRDEVLWWLLLAGMENTRRRSFSNEY